MALAKVDELIDSVLYRPFMVKAFQRLPRWWNCELAKLSVALDERWSTGYWDEGPVPGRPCTACQRRAAPFVIDGPAGEIPLCGWCRVEGPILTQADLDRALATAASKSIAWSWS